MDILKSVAEMGTLLLGLAALSVIITHSGGTAQVISATGSAGSNLINAATLSGGNSLSSTGNFSVGSGMSNLLGLGG